MNSGFVGGGVKGSRQSTEIAGLKGRARADQLTRAQSLLVIAMSC